MGFNCGIVGLPNVGKSTLFNALTQTASAEAQNYPFCTIDPNLGKVRVADPRLDKLAQIAGSAKIIPTQMEIVDIAGLVKGASQGEGLGNQFLGHIRNTDAILHIVRCFDNDDVIHITGGVDPIRDIEVVEMELMLADLESLKNRDAQIAKKNNLELSGEKTLLRKLIEWLEGGEPVSQLNLTSEERRFMNSFHLITEKPVLYVCNVKESEIVSGNAYSRAVEEFANRRNCQAIIASAVIESEIAIMNDEVDRSEYIQSIGLAESGLARIVRRGYDLLNLITFFTVGPTEARAWTIVRGTRAPGAAAVIHTDFERGFICAETINYEDFVFHNGEGGAKLAGKMRLEGKEYVVNDGDILHFRFNV
ncbi:MAG: redox-regulated ATPase YchF [Holosporaceae bacterium]|nr:redox-regulated ATPase YchF [Holosporaceae bacterium]